MKPSIFQQYVEKFLPMYTFSVYQSIEGRDLTNQIPFLFRGRLTEVYSPDARFQAISANYDNLAADIVAIGSAMPLKSRDAIESYVGELPKIGVDRTLNEREILNINAMINQNRPETEIINRIFADVPFAINAVDIRIEDMFLSMLSTGYGLAPDNVGGGARFGMNFRSENKMGASTAAWGATNATPMADIQRIVDKAENDGHILRYAYTDSATINNMCKSDEVRSAFGFVQTNSASNGSLVPVLDFDQLASLFMRKWGIELIRVVRSIRTEVNGVRSTHNAWESGIMTFTSDYNVGDLVYAQCADEAFPDLQVNYTKPNNYTLISRFAELNPKLEHTQSQAMVLPVFNNVQRIYLLNTKEVSN